MFDLSGATSVSETMRRHAREIGDRPALAIVGTPVDRATAQWLTYAQLDQAARVFAQELRRACPIGSRVLLLHPTSAEFVAGFLGCLYAGMVAVPSSMPGRYRQDQRRVLAIAEDAEVGCALITPDEWDEVTTWVEQEGFTMPVLALRVDLTRHADDLDVFPADLQTLAVLQYTSGSTNDPKGNMVTHGNLLANAASMATAFPARDGRMYGGWLPNYHDMGLMGIILTPLLAGYGTALMRSCSSASGSQCMVAFGLCICWMAILAGILLHTPAAVPGVLIGAVMPLSFGSNVFASADSMPGWVQAWVNINPVTLMTEVNRALLLGEGDVTGPLLGGLAWMAGFVAVFFPLSMRAYRRRLGR
ncbi:AMP-binding protein [Streptomyces sp. NPDC088554]|uniref:AMP-binding protein n=1 Tax=Streptomyces sp. NPDC088554 TaxID=3365865 RepID=UPI0037FAF948